MTQDYPVLGEFVVRDVELGLHLVGRVPSDLGGNFPQAFSHLGLINTARNLTQRDQPATVRPQP